MAGVSKCMKYSMFIFNFFFWVCGCIILGFSIWIRVTGGQQGMDSSMFAGVNLLIAVGAIIMILGFLGCCGAAKESRCMLILFFAVLLLILIIQIAGGVLGAVNKSKVESAFELALSTMVDSLQSTTGKDKEYQEQFQKFERKNKCCGLTNGPQDWGENFKPSSNICQCEPEEQSSDLCTKYQSKYIYKKIGGKLKFPFRSGHGFIGFFLVVNDYQVKPCGEVIMQQIKDNLVIIMGIAFGLAAVEILGLVFSMSLYCQIGRK